MKLLVFAHQLEIGGTQTNAIDVCAALRDLHGVDVVLFATPGPAVALAEQKALRYVPAPDAFVHPSPTRMRALRDLVRRERPDAIHAWDWWQCIDAYYVEHLLARTPLVVTDMYMTLTRILPKALPTTFGTPEIVDLAKAAGRTRAELLLPPVDVNLNAPGVVDSKTFREEWGIGPGDIVLVSVSRLDLHMKAESLHRTADAVRRLGREFPLRFVVVGDGPGRPDLERVAADVNRELGRSAIILTGQLIDPRPAYEAADIVVGMGGSALRAMAFGKPLIVVGERGFTAPFNPDTADSFYYKGMYGFGNGDPDNAPHVGHVRRLAEQPDQLSDLGRFSREFVVRHFALDKAAARVAALIRSASENPAPISTAAFDGLRTAAVLLRERRLISYRFWKWLKT